MMDSNHQPAAYEAAALTTELMALVHAPYVTVTLRLCSALQEHPRVAIATERISMIHEKRMWG